MGYQAMKHMVCFEDVYLLSMITGEFHGKGKLALFDPGFIHSDDAVGRHHCFPCSVYCFGLVFVLGAVH